MSLVSSFPVTIEENAGFPSTTVLYYPSGYPGTPFDFTGYSAQWMFRVNVSDVSPVLTLTPTFSTTGSFQDTITLVVSAANANTLVSAVPNLVGFQDVLLTSGTGTKSYLWIQQPFTIIRAVTR